jgi:hypothetical protein
MNAELRARQGDQKAANYVNINLTARIPTLSLRCVRK